jgi:hypothetical protein
MTAWTGGGVSTAEQTLRRRCDASGTPEGWTDPSLEFTNHTRDDLSGLGNRDECD